MHKTHSGDMNDFSLGNKARMELVLRPRISLNTFLTPGCAYFLLRSHNAKFTDHICTDLSDIYLHLCGHVRWCAKD